MDRVKFHYFLVLTIRLVYNLFWVIFIELRIILRMPVTSSNPVGVKREPKP